MQPSNPPTYDTLWIRVKMDRRLCTRPLTTKTANYSATTTDVTTHGDGSAARFSSGGGDTNTAAAVGVLALLAVLVCFWLRCVARAGLTGGGGVVVWRWR